MAGHAMPCHAMKWLHFESIKFVSIWPDFELNAVTVDTFSSAHNPYQILLWSIRFFATFFRDLPENLFEKIVERERKPIQQSHTHSSHFKCLAISSSIYMTLLLISIDVNCRNIITINNHFIRYYLQRLHKMRNNTKLTV